MNIRLVLFALFLVVPLVELFIIVQVGQSIGVAWTILLLLTVSVVGAYLVRREGTRAWQQFRTALAEARMPTLEVAGGALLLLGGALMLTPGFLTDVVGLLLVIPATRQVAARAVAGRMKVVTIGRGPFGGGGIGPSGDGGGRAGGGAGGRRPGAPSRPGRADGGAGGSRPGGPPRGGRRGSGGDRTRPDDDDGVVDVEVVSIERNRPPDVPPDERG